jgi:CubicO group peptidase (beta-lactamase class C family)
MSRFHRLTRFPLLVLSLLYSTAASSGETQVTISGTRWLMNGRPTYGGSPAEGLLMNVRMVNAVFEDTGRPDFDAEANTDEFVRRIPEYVGRGMRAFTLCLQGGMPGYEGAVNSAFSPDGSLRELYLRRVQRVVEECDRQGAVVILGCYYQRQDQILRDEAALRRGVVNVANWIKANRYRNVVLEIANEYGHGGFNHPALKSAEGQVALMRLARETVPGLLVSTSGLGHGRADEAVANAADFLLIHYNNTPLDQIPGRIDALKKFGKPVVCNEDVKTGQQGAEAARVSVERGASWGLMLQDHNQKFPFAFHGAADDPIVYEAVARLTAAGEPAPERKGETSYFPPPDSSGGWRTLDSAERVRAVAGMDLERLDKAFQFIQGSTKNGGLLVVRHGWLAYERYFGLGHREAAPNLASCGKSFTSMAVGILLRERPDLFPAGLEQRIFTPDYLPPEAFPLSDPRKAEIKLGQLLAFTAGIRGNNPCHVGGKPVNVAPLGPDGWPAMVDAVALGRRETQSDGHASSAVTLWCPPGEGYSYATSSIHIASIMLRHVTGRELQDYVDEHLARPLGWQRWGWGYRHAREVTHTPGGGGIALRGTDMLRFGFLLLNEGRWQQRQLIPADYVRHATRRSPYNGHYPYSLQFNVNTDGDEPGLPRDAYWKSGSGGHVLYVVPSLDLVVWKLGGRDSQYGTADTGLPIHPDAARTADPRTGWKPSPDAHDATTQTLEMVIQAIKT